MKTLTIERNKKEQTLAIATVRSLLKKAGFNIGSWSDNGRITGMANFHGDLEIRGNEYDWKNESKKSDISSAWIHTWTKFVNIKVRSWNNKTDIQNVAQVLIDNGLIIKEVKSDYLIVDNK